MIEKNGKRFVSVNKADGGLKNSIKDIAFTLKKEGKGEITSDVNGSYTGLTIDGETPVQDSDDL